MDSLEVLPLAATDAFVPNSPVFSPPGPLSEITPTASSTGTLMLAAAAVAEPIRINFQPGSAPVPEGYLIDTGLAYDEARGSGWITEASAGGTMPTPLDITPNARDRDVLTGQPLDTLLHMQYPANGNPTAVRTPAAFEYALANGRYSVSVSVGDPSHTDSQHKINVEGVEAIPLFTPTAGSLFQQRTVEVEVADGKLTIDAIGGTNTKINFLEIAPIAPPPPTSVDLKINFQPNGAPVPSGYLSDTGGAFSDVRRFGWVRQDSLGSGMAVPLEITGNARDRNRSGVDQRLDTLLHMQYPTGLGNPSAVKVPAAWEYALPNGSYYVTVGAGDQPRYDSSHVINVEGVNALSFTSTPAREYAQATVLATVTDGRLTLDASGGTNTKINFAEIKSADVAAASEIELKNLDNVPYSDRLAFNRIGSLTNPPSNGVHNVATVQIQNLGAAALDITKLTLTGPWQFKAGAPLPTSIPAGGQANIPLQFIATGGDTNRGMLAIESNDADEPTTFVDLSGFWQSLSERGQEPSVAEIVDVFGYLTQITNPGQVLSNSGILEAVGDEVLSPYWLRADPSQPVSIQQLAAYHSQGNTATVNWYDKASVAVNNIFTHAGIDGQSLLPRLNNNLSKLAQGTFSPNAAFGFKIDGEWSDPTKNRKPTSKDQGHHVRFWPVRDRTGQTVPNTWLMIMDYAGINYDYNDNIYLISNIAPETV